MTRNSKTSVAGVALALAVLCVRPVFAGPLHLAASAGDVEEVKNLLAQGADVSEADDNGWTALHHAAHTNQKAVAELLIASGVELHARTNRGESALHLAAHNAGVADLIKLLLARGAEVDSEDDMGVTPLHQAAGSGDQTMLQPLLARGAGVNATSDNGETPLHRAAQSGHPQAVELLLARGAEVDAKYIRTGATPLHLAAARQEGGRIVKLLLAKGADVNATATFTRTPFDGYTHVRTPLHIAALVGSKDAVDALLAHGAAVDARVGMRKKEYRRPAGAYNLLFHVISLLGNLKDMTALHFAAFAGHDEVVELLLARGADAEAKDAYGQTPLHVTTLIGYTSAAAERLLARGADPDARDEAGATPLHVAVIKRQKALAELLLARGADVDAKDKYGDNALRFALRQADPEMIELLRRHGATE